MAVCQHVVCTCEVREDETHCSEWCAANPSDPECHCHHAGCEAPHHH